MKYCDISLVNRIFITCAFLPKLIFWKLLIGLWSSNDYSIAFSSEDKNYLRKPGCPVLYFYCKIIHFSLEFRNRSTCVVFTLEIHKGFGIGMRYFFGLHNGRFCAIPAVFLQNRFWERNAFNLCCWSGGKRSLQSYLFPYKMTCITRCFSSQALNSFAKVCEM